MTVCRADWIEVGSVHSTRLLVKRLLGIVALDHAEIDLVAGIQQRAREQGAGSRIVTGADGASHPRLITSGWACRPRVLADGRCQILSILLPGDIVGDDGDRRPLAMMPVMALTKVHSVGIKPMLDAVRGEPARFRRLRHALVELRRLEEQQLLDHVVRLGRQNALQRVAHCLLELYNRARAIDFVHGDTFLMPLTQELLGDTLGLSLVHVNRTLGQLRRDGLIRSKAGVIAILDVARLVRVADYERGETIAVPARDAVTLT